MLKSLQAFKVAVGIVMFVVSFWLIADNVKGITNSELKSVV